MMIGYARLSKPKGANNKEDVNSELKRDHAARLLALKEAGCERTFTETASGGRWDRPELHKLLDQLRDGDVVVVWKLDRLSRSLLDVLKIMEKIEKAKAGFHSITENIDTTSPGGRMMMHMLGAFAEFERAMIRDRTLAGLEIARLKGKLKGRGPKLKPEQRAAALKMLTSGDLAVEVAKVFEVHPQPSAG
jgi:DNA invertase Pin-like site-specific DNA recombinase